CEQPAGLEDAIERAVPNVRTPREIENREAPADVHRFAEAQSKPLARNTDLFGTRWAARGCQHFGYFLAGNQLVGQACSNARPRSLQSLQLCTQRVCVQV